MSRELIVATKVRCDLCGDTEVIIATSDTARIDRLLTSFHEWQVGQDDACLGCINDGLDDVARLEASND